MHQVNNAMQIEKKRKTDKRQQKIPKHSEAKIIHFIREEELNRADKEYFIFVSTYITTSVEFF